MNKTITILFSFVLFTSCISESRSLWPKLEQEDISYGNRIEIQLTKVRMDSVFTSQSVFSTVTDNKIYIFDKYLSKLYLFDINGRILSEHLGFGRGPSETVIRNAAFFSVSGEGDIVICGSNLDYQIVRNNDSVEEYNTLKYLPDYKGDTDNFYNYSYAWNNMQSSFIRGRVYVSMDCEHPNMNYFMTTEKILSDKKHIGVINTESGETSMMVRGYPEIYHDDPDLYSSVNLLNFTNYKKGKFIVNFEASPEIYICSESGLPEEVFGAEGHDVDKDYLRVNSFDEIDKYRINRSDKGRYSTLKYIEETDLIFRSYLTGTHCEYDGLQIYKDNKIIGDIAVPKGFHVIGNIGDTYISNVYFDGETCYFYKFTL